MLAKGCRERSHETSASVIDASIGSVHLAGRRTAIGSSAIISPLGVPKMPHRRQVELAHLILMPFHAQPSRQRLD